MPGKTLAEVAADMVAEIKKSEAIESAKNGDFAAIESLLSNKDKRIAELEAQIKAKNEDLIEMSQKLKKSDFEVSRLWEQWFESH